MESFFLNANQTDDDLASSVTSTTSHTVMHIPNVVEITNSNQFRPSFEQQQYGHSASHHMHEKHFQLNEKQPEDESVSGTSSLSFTNLASPHSVTHSMRPSSPAINETNDNTDCDSKETTFIYDTFPPQLQIGLATLAASVADVMRETALSVPLPSQTRRSTERFHWRWQRWLSEHTSGHSKMYSWEEPVPTCQGNFYRDESDHEDNEHDEASCNDNDNSQTDMQGIGVSQHMNSGKHRGNRGSHDSDTRWDGASSYNVHQEEINESNHGAIEDNGSTPLTHTLRQLTIGTDASSISQDTVSSFHNGTITPNSASMSQSHSSSTSELDVNRSEGDVTFIYDSLPPNVLPALDALRNQFRRVPAPEVDLTSVRDASLQLSRIIESARTKV